MGWIIGKGIGIPFRMGGSGLGSSYWTNRSLLKYDSRSDTDLIESISGRNAKILPSCGLLTTTVDNNYARLLSSAFGSADSSGYLEFRGYFANGVTYYPFASTDESRTDRYVFILVQNNTVSFNMRDPGGTPKSDCGISNTNAVADGWHTIRITGNGTTWVMSVDGTGVAVTDIGTNHGKWFDFGLPTSRDNILIGAVIITTPAYSTLGYVDYVDYNNKNIWYVTGIGNYVFDIKGGFHLTWSGTNHVYYDENASTYLLDNGYSIWVKSGEPDEIVPYISGVPYASKVLTGYAKRADYSGNATKYNYAPALIDFDPDDSAHTDIAVWDKSDATIHIDTGSMDYYDALNVYRWRYDELRDPNNYNSYFNVGYKGLMLIGGSVNVDGFITDFNICHVLLEDQTGTNQYNLAKYLGLDGIIPKTGTIPVYDGDNYLTFTTPTDPIALSLVFMGDSTLTTYAGGTGVNVLFTQNTNYTITNLATVGDQCADQETKWDALTADDKLLFDYVIMLIGQNDKAYSVAQFATVYQSLVDKIRSEINASCKIIAGTMTPCRQSLIDAGGDWETAYNGYLLHNISISGAGANPITDLDEVTTDTHSDLADVNDNLDAAYDSGDGLHPNTAGKTVLYNIFNGFIV